MRSNASVRLASRPSMPMRAPASPPGPQRTRQRSVAVDAAWWRTGEERARHVAGSTGTRAAPGGLPKRVRGILHSTSTSPSSDSCSWSSDGSSGCALTPSALPAIATAAMIAMHAARVRRGTQCRLTLTLPASVPARLRSAARRRPPRRECCIHCAVGTWFAPIVQPGVPSPA